MDIDFAILLRVSRLAVVCSTAALLYAACGGQTVESVCSQAQDKLRACRMTGVPYPETQVLQVSSRLPFWIGEECDDRDLCLARCTNRTSCSVIVALGGITNPDQEVPSRADWDAFHECVNGCSEP